MTDLISKLEQAILAIEKASRALESSVNQIEAVCEDLARRAANLENLNRRSHDQ